MSNPLPVVILATQADLDAVEVDLRMGRRRPLRGFSVQITGISPHLALTAETSLNAGYRASGWTEALALAIPFAALMAAIAASLPGLSLSPPLLAALALSAGAAGAGLGAYCARQRARRRMARSLAKLRAAMQQAAACGHPRSGGRRARSRPAPVSQEASLAAEILVLADERDRVSQPLVTELRRDAAAAPLAALR
ncbi:hypothetical protein [Dinoroseobacter sp. S375]|uniref:hypothetical protein n=1 Tax=Dinoroseobacter sp. S375 TaxID=3415136 RepID=UPI003C7E5C8C